MARLATAGSSAGSTPMIVRLATAPASVLGRVHPDLNEFTDADRARFATARVPFAMLAATAVLYPLIASAIHRFGGPPTFGDILAQALSPTFDVVYTESLPFMVAAILIGVLSPALGVLFMTVFIPADLLASFDTVELQNNQFASWPVQAWIARFASLGLLWILVVEIPIRGRRIAARFGSNAGGAPVMRLVVANALAAAFLTYAWAILTSLLIVSVYTWTALQQAANRGSDALWYYWWVLATAAGIGGFIAGFWPRLRVATSDASAPPVGNVADPAPPPPASLRATIVRHTVGSLAFAALCGALMTGAAEALLVFLGALLAGPGLTLLLRVMPAIGPLGRLDDDARTVAATVLAVGVAFVCMTVLWDVLNVTSDFGFALVVVIVVNVFRFVRDVGVDAPRPGKPLAATVATA